MIYGVLLYVSAHSLLGNKHHIRTDGEEQEDTVEIGQDIRFEDLPHRFGWRIDLQIAEPLLPPLFDLVGGEPADLLRHVSFLRFRPYGTTDVPVLDVCCFGSVRARKISAPGQIPAHGRRSHK